MLMPTTAPVEMCLDDPGVAEPGGESGESVAPLLFPPPVFGIVVDLPECVAGEPGFPGLPG